MKIRTLDLHENAFNKGLRPIKLNNLGQLVALFGPNGAGKTRILQVVNQTIIHDDESIDRLKDYSLLHENGTLDEKHIGVSSVIMDRYENVRSRNRAIFISIKNIELAREGNTSPSEQDKFLDDIVQWGSVNDAMKAIIPLVERMAGAHFDKPNPNVDPQKEGPWPSLFEETRRIIRSLMSMELSYGKENGRLFLYLQNRKLDTRELSSGQKVIFIYVAYLISYLIGQAANKQKDGLKGAIILIDEPELHLHPNATINFIVGLREVVGDKGQIWVATHSISLLTQLKRNEAWLVSNGEVFPMTKGSSVSIVEALVGGQKDVEKLRHILQEPAHQASVEFSSQCLIEPGVAVFRRGDPQLVQLAEGVSERLKGSAEEVVILDFGAGEGRFGLELLGIKNKFNTNIKYIPVEPNKELRGKIFERCGSLVSKNEVYSSVNLVRSYDRKVDVVIMCNVLHEIRPLQWASSVREILKRLKSDGIIIFCEDLEMGVGELPNEFGFLILREEQVKILFGIQGKPRLFKHREDRYKKRLLCMAFSKKQINFTNNNVLNALIHRKDQVGKIIKKYRTGTNKMDYREGALYAFYSQLFTNCVFSIEALSSDQR